MGVGGGGDTWVVEVVMVVMVVVIVVVVMFVVVGVVVMVVVVGVVVMVVTRASTNQIFRGTVTCIVCNMHACIHTVHNNITIIPF